MNSGKPEHDDTYFVVMNHEEQYSIWPSHLSVPGGWECVGEPRSKSECLDFIQTTWTDMRPLSLRRAMASAST